MNVQVNLDLNEVLKGDANRREIGDRLLCDEEFMDSFINLMVYGSTNQDSWPNDEVLSALRVKLLTGFKDFTHAELVARMQRESDEMHKTWTKIYELESHMKRILRLFQNAQIEDVKAEVKGTSEGKPPITRVSFSVVHSASISVSDMCNACDLIKFIRATNNPIMAAEVEKNETIEQLLALNAELSKKAFEAKPLAEGILFFENQHRDDQQEVSRMRDTIAEIYALRGEDPEIARLCNKELV